jgi:hypothetical protein
MTKSNDVHEPSIDWRGKNAYYHEQVERFLTFHASSSDAVLVLGCGKGEIFDRVPVNAGVGIDVDAGRIGEAVRRTPNQDNLRFHHVSDYATLPSLGRTFDIVILYDVVAEAGDIEAIMASLRRWMSPRTRLVVNFHSHLWMPILRAAEILGLKRPIENPSWVTIEDMMNFATLTDFEIVFHTRMLLLPKRLAGLGSLINRFFAPLPFFSLLCLENVIVLRPLGLQPGLHNPSVSVVIPARNEAGNIENAVNRIPSMGKRTEIIFVEGHSTDETWNEILRVQAEHPEMGIKALRQPGRGKSDAVRYGFNEAEGDILMILDADLTVSPEALPKFHQAIVQNKGEFINGCRLVYPLERGSMQFLNMVANKCFGWLFTWLIGQRYRDTLCGTKVFWTTDYRRISAGRSFFGDSDPFGDFDLIFGAAKLGLKTVEIPIRYRERVYGRTNISRFLHGLLLLRMSLVAAWKLKFGRY